MEMSNKQGMDISNVRLEYTSKKLACVHESCPSTAGPTLRPIRMIEKVYEVAM
jgi:hypothetical protein